MTAYVDSSALLRLVLREPGALDGLRAFAGLVSSELLAVESLRSIDRLRVHGSLTMEEAATGRHAVAEWLEGIDLVLMRPPVLSRAGDPLPAPLGTLDAIHLATALTWRERTGQALVMATHDHILGAAARAYGLDVEGI